MIFKYISLIFFFFSFFINFSFWFEIKMSDSISSFFAENKEILHYSNIPFYQIDLYDEKNNDLLVDLKQLKESKEKFEIYCKLLKQNWYNSISLDDLNHITIFDKLWFYKWTQIEKRNKIYINYYKELINIASKHDLWVYITTDMQFYTDTMKKKIWKIDDKNKKIKQININAFEELFKNFPNISWVIMRIWEWWKAYNSWVYKSKIIYTNPESVNEILKYLLPIFEKNDKKLIFRTWTIWIWKIWDLITNKDIYNKTFDWIYSDNLIISIKHTLWDFFWFEKINPIIWYWDLKQIVEIQIRREYEWWWDFPNYMWDFYNELINKIKDKKNVIWVWNWNQTWWWWWWKNIIFNFWFNFWNEINFYIVWEILKNSKENFSEKEIIISILNKYDFSQIEKDILYDILKNSREIIKKWWYINDFRKKDLVLFGINIPPLNRIWWDKITTSPIILSLIYNNLDSKINTIEESSYLLWIQKQELESWKKNSRKNELNQKILYSLENRYRIFEINHIFKKAFILYFQTWEKKYFEIIDEKIKDYYKFISNKPYFNFNFSEIYKFYSKNLNISVLNIDENLFKKIMIYLNIFSFISFLFIYFFYKKIKIFYKKNKKNKIYIFSFLVFIIFLLIATPFFFLSKYNFYWLIVDITYLIMILMIIYFFLLSKILNKIFKINIKLKTSFWKIIYFISPILIILEFVIIISYLFWEQFFWNFLVLWLLENNIKIFISFLFIIYLIIFSYYSFKFSNIYKYIKDIKYKKIIYLSIFSFLFLFLFIIYSLDFSKILIVSVIKDILPTYFYSAWSDIGDFF